MCLCSNKTQPHHSLWQVIVPLQPRPHSSIFAHTALSFMVGMFNLPIPFWVAIRAVPQGDPKIITKVLKNSNKVPSLIYPDPLWFPKSNN